MNSDGNNENTYIIDPQSGAEMARLLNQDHLMNEAMGDLFPKGVKLAHIHHVLDVACGPGGWAQEVALAHPDVQIEGFDISQVMIEFARQRAQVMGLHNSSFQVIDARSPLPFADGSFDLVNARFVAAFLPKKEWPQVVKEYARITRSGGTIVLTELDIFGPGNTNSQAVEALNDLCREAVSRAGLETQITAVLGQFLQEAGCHNIQHKWHSLDFSMGTPSHQTIFINLQYAFKLVQPFLLKMVDTTQEHLDGLYEKGLREMMQDDFHGYTHFLTIWGTRS